MILKILVLEEIFLIILQSYSFTLSYIFSSNVVPVGREMIHLKSISNQSTGFHRNRNENAFIFFSRRDTTADSNLLNKYCLNDHMSILCAKYLMRILNLFGF